MSVPLASPANGEPAVRPGAAAIAPSEWRRRRAIVRATFVLCAILILGSWIFAMVKGSNAAVDRIADSAFWLLGGVVFVYIGAPVADDAFHKFAMARALAPTGTGPR